MANSCHIMHLYTLAHIIAIVYLHVLKVRSITLRASNRVQKLCVVGKRKEKLLMNVL